jgi:hypothetical protein
MRNAYKNPTAEEVCQFIIDRSLLTNYEHVGAIKNRKVYRLWRDASS